MACPGLREMDFGDFEGRSAAELKEDVRYHAWVDSWCETVSYTHLDVYKRQVTPRGYREIPCER